MFCHHCGAPVDPNARFCPACGSSLAADSAPPMSVPPTAGPQGGFAPPAKVEVKVWHWIGEGWNIVKDDALLFALMTLIVIVLSAMVPLILQGPLIAGLHFAAMKKMLGGRVEFGDVFKGFNFFVHAMVASLVVSLFVFLGALACIIPGLVVAAMYFFVYLFIIDRKMEFWPAMQASHAIVKQDYLGFTLLLLAFIPVHLLGVLCCLVGLLLTIPVQYAAITVAYKELVGFATTKVD